MVEEFIPLSENSGQELGRKMCLPPWYKVYPCENLDRHGWIKLQPVSTGDPPESENFSPLLGGGCCCCRREMKEREREKLSLKKSFRTRHHPLDVNLNSERAKDITRCKWFPTFSFYFFTFLFFLSPFPPFKWSYFCKIISSPFIPLGFVLSCNFIRALALRWNKSSSFQAGSDYQGTRIGDLVTARGIPSRDNKSKFLLYPPRRQTLSWFHAPSELTSPFSSSTSYTNFYYEHATTEKQIAVTYFSPQLASWKVWRVSFFLEWN